MYCCEYNLCFFTFFYNTNLRILSQLALTLPVERGAFENIFQNMKLICNCMLLSAFVFTIKKGFHGLQIRNSQRVFPFPQAAMHYIHAKLFVLDIFGVKTGKVNAKVWKRRFIS